MSWIAAQRSYMATEHSATRCTCAPVSVGSRISAVAMVRMMTPRTSLARSSASEAMPAKSSTAASSAWVNTADSRGCLPRPRELISCRTPTTSSRASCNGNTSMLRVW